MKSVIGLLGKKGAGKGTVAEVFVKHGFTELAFATHLYREVAEAFGISVDVLSDRETKETPLSCLSLNACQDPKFYGIAVHILKEQQRTGKGGGYMVNPVVNQFHLSPRRAMQLWGTEYRRAEDNYYWVKKLSADLKALQEQGKSKFVISDVREHFEASYIKRRDNGMVVKVNRPKNPYEDAGTAGHSSETQIDTITFDTLFENNGSVQKLQSLTEDYIFSNQLDK